MDKFKKLVRVSDSFQKPRRKIKDSLKRVQDFKVSRESVQELSDYLYEDGILLGSAVGTRGNDFSRVKIYHEGSSSDAKRFFESVKNSHEELDAIMKDHGFTFDGVEEPYLFYVSQDFKKGGSKQSTRKSKPSVKFAWINLIADLGDLLVEYDPSKASEDTVIPALEAIINEGYSQMPEEPDDEASDEDFDAYDEAYDEASYELRQKVFNASGDGWSIVAYNSEGDRWESMEYFMDDPHWKDDELGPTEEDLEKVYGKFEEWALDF